LISSDVSAKWTAEPVELLAQPVLDRLDVVVDLAVPRGDCLGVLGAEGAVEPAQLGDGRLRGPVGRHRHRPGLRVPGGEGVESAEDR
jgi:hypothetical protein